MATNLVSKIQRTWLAMSGVLLRSAARSLGVNALGFVLLLGLQLMLARLMSVSSYGTYLYVISILNILVLAASLGFDSAVLRFIPHFVAEGSWGQLKGLLLHSNRITLIVSSSASLVLAVVSGFLILRRELDLELGLTLILGALLLPIWALSNLRQASLRAFKRIIEARAPDVVLRPIVFAGIAIGLYLFRGPLSATATMTLHVVSSLVVLFCGWVLLKRWIPHPAQSVEPIVQAKEWNGIAMPLMFVAGMGAAISELDKLLLGLLVTVDSVAIYSVSARLAVLMLFVLEAVHAIAVPLMAEYLSARSREELQLLVARVALLATMGSFSLSLPLIIFGRQILAFFGPEYVDGYQVLCTLCLANIFFVSVAPAGVILMINGTQNKLLKILVFCFLLSLVLQIPFIGWAGIEGAALITALMLVLRSTWIWKAAKDSSGVDCSIFAYIKLKK